MPRGTKFPQEMRERAVRMVAELGDLPCSAMLGRGEASRRQNVGSYCTSDRTGLSDRARVQSHAPMGNQSGAPVG
jgi:hypothetical protein